MSHLIDMNWYLLICITGMVLAGWIMISNAFNTLTFTNLAVPSFLGSAFCLCTFNAFVPNRYSSDQPTIIAFLMLLTLICWASDRWLATCKMDKAGLSNGR